MRQLQSFGLNPEMLTSSNVYVDCIMPERAAIGRLNSAEEIRMQIWKHIYLCCLPIYTKIDITLCVQNSNVLKTKYAIEETRLSNIKVHQVFRLKFPLLQIVRYARYSRNKRSAALSIHDQHWNLPNQIKAFHPQWRRAFIGKWNNKH